MIISLPVKTAPGSKRGESGAAGIFRQLRVAGSKAAPSVTGSASRSLAPPQITISRPVQTAEWPARPAIGAWGRRGQPGAAVVAGEEGALPRPEPAGLADVVDGPADEEVDPAPPVPPAVEVGPPVVAAAVGRAEAVVPGPPAAPPAPAA